MYVILVYDVNVKRVGKMLKLCRRYLHWIQNSVFEGELTDLKLKQLKSEIGDLIDSRVDSVIIFTSRQERWMDKQIVGVDKNKLDQFL
ncbi:MAG: CRISPR-associated endonuclease Cas2 [Saprospirales bacterium]|nr:MAG: CRISPR-associated endonuclease Cas2 [Saprospirales bacterium]